MTFYTTRTKAINKLSISGKIFDWLCFLNGISAYCPRKKGNKNETIYFLSKDIKTIQKDKLLKNIQQINIWKNTIKMFKNRKKIEKMLSNINNIPSYNLDSSIKKKFFFFKEAFDKFKNLLSFVLLVPHQINESSNYLKNYSKLYNIKKKLIFIFSSLKNVKQIFITNEAIYLQYKILGKKIEIYFPKKVNFNLKKNFCETLSEYYICLFNFILKKLIIFYNFKFINCLCIENFDIYKSKFEFLKRNYKYKKNSPFSYGITAIKYVKFQNKFNENNCKIKDFPWTYSKNINLPYQFSLLKNPIFYVENENLNESFVFILKCLSCKILLRKNDNKITHIICRNIKKKYSLICLNLSFSLICDILNNQNILPIFLSKIQNLKIDIINPFYLKMNENKEKNKAFYFRQKYGKKRIYIKEIYDLNNNNWIVLHKDNSSEKKIYKNFAKFHKKKLIFIKLFSS